MARKKTVTLFVLGLLLITLAFLAIDQPGIPTDPLDIGEPLSCPATWDVEGGLLAIETDVQTEEAIIKDQSPWSSSEASHLKL